MPPKSKIRDAFTLVGIESIRRMQKRFKKPEDLLSEASAEAERLISMSKQDLEKLPETELSYLHDLFGTAFVLEKRRSNRWLPLPIEDDMNFSPSDRAKGPYVQPLMQLADLLSRRPH